MLNKFIVRVSGFGNSERLLPGTRALIFNNLVVLSRAFWVYDGFYVGCCDDFPTNFSGLNTKLCQRDADSIVVSISVGVSPLELSRTSDG